MNTVDEEGNFVSYTAKVLEAEKPEVPEVEDKLVTGNYVLTEDSYIETAFHKAEAFIAIDAEKDTFNIHPYKDGVADLESDKGSGTISFDAATGVYTMTYATPEQKVGATTTFVVVEDGIKFTSPMHYGGAKMNTVDEDGNFVPYTAKLLAAEFEKLLVSGNYVLTEDSYMESAMMKLPAYIVIDAEKMIFNIHPYKDNVADLATDKGSGMITFDKKTGVYTMTYETVESKRGETTTFTATENSITFTSPMHYGGAKMNTVDENGNFVSYTAKLLADEKPAEKPAKPATPNNKVPQTGDSSNMMLMIVLLLAGGAGVGSSLYLRRRSAK